jgi:NAD(P)-dependent dehydrogenase (short-subunit alcohol dehydrogenase family)
MKLKNETALITGSTSGIGKKLAEILLALGCKVAICSRNRKKVDETVAEFKKVYGNSVMGAACDVSRFEELKQIAAETTARFGSIRIVIANAGILPIYGPFQYLTEEQLVSAAHAVINTNLIGTINTVGAVLPHMLEQQYGRIITLTGGGDGMGVPNISLYAATKGGISSFSKCLAAELKKGEADIKLNIFQPGPMKTNLNKNLKLVSGWKDEKAFREDWEKLYDSANLDIEKCCKRVLPYIIPSCKANGKVFLGFSLLRMLPKFMKIQKVFNEV